mmetsp:Transcript_41775/g.75030  ORF Transcript_41775/g.75030 Transcript_41775/m.75030 type:complete len:319 (+) Transcript_41775:3229-4185(+)
MTVGIISTVLRSRRPISCGSCSPANAESMLGREVTAQVLLDGAVGTVRKPLRGVIADKCPPPEDSGIIPVLDTCLRRLSPSSSTTAVSSFVACLASWLRMALTSFPPRRIAFIASFIPNLPDATPPSIDIMSSERTFIASRVLSSSTALTVFCTRAQRRDLDMFFVEGRLPGPEAPVPSCCRSLRGLLDKELRSRSSQVPASLCVRFASDDVMAASLSCIVELDPRMLGETSSPLSTILVNISASSIPGSEVSGRPGPNELLLVVFGPSIISTACANCFSVCVLCSCRLAAFCDALLWSSRHCSLSLVLSLRASTSAR